MNKFYSLDFDAITLEDCMDLYEKCNGYVFINDGHITTIVRGDSE